jgi:hypothetical protein
MKKLSENVKKQAKHFDEWLEKPLEKAYLRGTVRPNGVWLQLACMNTERDFDIALEILLSLKRDYREAEAKALYQSRLDALVSVLSGQSASVDIEQDSEYNPIDEENHQTC